MAENILILEDEQERVDVMRCLLESCYPQMSVWFTDSAEGMIESLQMHLAETRIISLDHDLPVYRDPEGQLIDHGNGREVADFLAGLQPVCPVGIHSTNVPAAIGMESALSAAGWETFRLTPYGDLEWIEEAWLPRLGQLLDRC